MKSKNVFRILINIFIIISVIIIVSIDYSGCYTESIVNVTTPPDTIPNEIYGEVLNGTNYKKYSDSLVGVPGATVKLIGSGNYSAITDSIGIFIIPDVQPGSYTIEVTKNGYTSAYSDIDVVEFYMGVFPIFISEMNSPTVIGSNGGIIQITNTTIEIPPGALTSSQNISITPIITFDDQGIVLNAIDCQPNDLTFNSPIRITYKIPDDLSAIDTSEFSIYYFNKQNYTWEKTYIPKTIQNDSISIFVNHFSQYKSTAKNSYVELIAITCDNGTFERQEILLQDQKTTYKNEKVTLYSRSYRLLKRYQLVYPCVPSGELLKEIINNMAGNVKIFPKKTYKIGECTDYNIKVYINVFRYRCSATYRKVINGRPQPNKTCSFTYLDGFFEQDINSHPHQNGNCHPQGGGDDKE